MPDDSNQILQEVLQKIAIGFDQAERGELYDGEEVFCDLLEKLDTGEAIDPTRASPDRSR